MSVDSRLREGLERSAASFVPTALDGAELAGSVARRRRTARRVTAGAAVVVALAIGAGVVVDRGSRTTAPPPVPAAPTVAVSAPTRVASADADALLATALVGEWTTGPVTTDLATAAMARTGTLGYREPVLAAFPLPGTFSITFDDLAYQARLDGGSQDEGTWYVKDGRLVLVPSCDHCNIVLAPDLHGGALRLALLEDTSPDVDRVPEAAYAAVLYTSTPFHRP
jgi:hypothetical protein